MSSAGEGQDKQTGAGWRRWSSTGMVWLAMLALLASAAPAATATQSSGDTATVTATDALYLRSCPVLTCQIVATVQLGDTVVVTGNEVDGYVPVRWQGRDGWAYRLFLTVGDEPARLVQNGVAGCNRVALIFNAGIGNAPSETILDTLVTTQAPVTLFAMGWWAEAYPDYLLRFETEANAVIGSHGNSQLFLTGTSDEEIMGEIRGSADAIERVLGYPPARYYTPYASDSDERVQHLVAGEGFLPVGWTVSAADYNQNDTPDGVYARVMNGAHDGAIIEFHLDGPATERSTALALPMIIRDLQAQGYQLVTVPELLLPCPSMS